MLIYAKAWQGSTFTTLYPQSIKMENTSLVALIHLSNLIFTFELIVL